MSKLYFEDLEVGDVYDLGEFVLDRDEMLEFAHRYDPQPIHVDPEAAEESMYGGLIASGWYTASKCMRIFADEFLVDTVSMGSFGVDELRWKKPGRPGDELQAEIAILETTPSTSRDDRGYVTISLEATDENGEVVLTWRSANIFLKRKAGDD